MNAINDSGINMKKSFIFYSLSYENKLFLIGKTSFDLNDALFKYKESLKIKTIDFIQNIDLLSIVQIEDVLLLNECESILKKQLIIKNYRQKGYNLLNQIYIGYVYHMSFNDIPFYIGSSKDPQKRLKDHLSALKTSHTKLYDFMNKVKIQSIEKFNTLKVFPICQYELETKDELKCMEQFYIEYYHYGYWRY